VRFTDFRYASGTSPQWTDRGGQLAYLSQRKWLTIRSFAGTGSDIALGTPRELLDAATFVETTPLVTPTANAYAVDGRRFHAAVRANDPAVSPDPADCELHAAPRPLIARAERDDVTRVRQAASGHRPVL
jgi:hypothetical protein